ncbi:hypothetical protein KUTeg_008460 [Tegillarca granosa]|uniref:EF-hand domain-containing protein n=1 Tax=Tegillarca granosa TaxID=220873 RepID=A0ABQ9F972_TEGGR|nr:hypothetical protein KUTeg_008460 [Tegillarca granosa]
MGNNFSVNSTQNTKKHELEDTIAKSVYERLKSQSGQDEVDSGMVPNAEDQASIKKKIFQYKVHSVLSDVDERAIKVDPKDYIYPFENLVFEGGGNKGLAYCGAVRVLEELGIYSNVRRLAGSSAGAMTATLLAVGYNSYEIEEFLSQNLSYFFLDHSYGYLSLLPNLIYGYGWNPGKRIYDWFGEKIAKKVGNPDITFSELYKKTGMELCIVVTNLNHMAEEYCHPKTTPDLIVRLAARMSMSIPGMFQAAQYTERGETNTYVDGWWLSLKPGESFIEKLQPLDALPALLEKENRFGTYNEKTIGFLLYADSERDIYRSVLEKRVGVQLPDKEVDSKLYREKQEKKNEQQKARREHRTIAIALDAFLKVLKKHNLDRNDVIDRKELKAALQDEEFSEKYRYLLFGDVTDEEAFNVLDIDGNGKIQYHELMNFVENSGVKIRQRFLGYHRKDINGLFSFLDTLQTTVLTNVKRVKAGTPLTPSYSTMWLRMKIELYSNKELNKDKYLVTKTTNKQSSLNKK